MGRQVFTASGTFNPPSGVTSVDVLRVDGGGAGGSCNFLSGGGGGGGGVAWLTGVAVSYGVPVTVTVGAGGTTAGTGNTITVGGNGGASAFGALVGTGGGGGGAGAGATRNGAAGGSGGGGGGDGAGQPTPAGGAGTAGIGHNGGNGKATSTAANRFGGGGGGAGAVGGDGGSAGAPTFGGAGGAGVDMSANVGTGEGVAGVFGGGGGGASTHVTRFPGPGGSGGGGAGSGGNGAGATVPAVAGAANTGGGGGGGGSNSGGGTLQPPKNGGSGIVIVQWVDPPPAVPTSVVATPDETEILLEWAAPTAGAGGPVDSYEVRLDGGAPVDVGLDLDYTFTGLTAGTSYTVEVRAVNTVGASSWVGDTVDTTAPTEPGYYRVELAVAGLSWDISSRDDVEYGPRLPMSLGWAMPDQVEFFPCQPDQTTLSFQLYVEAASDLATIVTGSTVTMAMYVDADPDADPWQTFSGIVVQLDGSSVQPAGGFLATVYCVDDTARLSNMVVGYSGDWPQESIYDRLDRICTEAGLTLETGFIGTGLGGTLAARPERPTDVLSAVREALKDVADEDGSTPGGPYYGRVVLYYDPSTTSLWAYVLYRRVPGEWQDPPNPVQMELDGCLVDAIGQWAKLPGQDGRSWVLVDGVTFGTPSGPPLVRNTSLVDTTPTNPTAVTRDHLGESLLPDGSTFLTGWYTRVLRYEAHVDPAPMGPMFVGGPGVASWAPLTVVIPVIVTDVLAKYDLEGVGYLAGTLTGARMVLPPGGRFYVELRLRPELLPGMELP